MSKIVWKDIDIYPDIMGCYEISEFGEIKSKTRYIEITSDFHGNIKRRLDEKILALREAPHTKNLFVSIRGRRANKKNYQLTVFVHRVVAQLFLPPPPTDRHIVVVHKDGNHYNNHYTNLKWITNREMKLEYLEKHPEIRFRLRDALIKQGFYGDPRYVRKLIKTKRYFELKDDGIYNNYTNDVATSKKSMRLNPIYDLFKDKLVEQGIFKFKNLTDQDRQTIIELLPKNVTNREKYEKP